jgi:hypothetical protein
MRQAKPEGVSICGSGVTDVVVPEDLRVNPSLKLSVDLGFTHLTASQLVVVHTSYSQGRVGR